LLAGALSRFASSSSVLYGPKSRWSFKEYDRPNHHTEQGWEIENGRQQQRPCSRLLSRPNRAPK